MKNFRVLVLALFSSLTVAVYGTPSITSISRLCQMRSILVFLTNTRSPEVLA